MEAVGFALLAILVIAFMAFWDWVKAQDKAQRQEQRRTQKTEARAAAKRVPLVASTWHALGIEQIDKMSGVQFERYIAGMIRSLGLEVAITKATGDFGVDLVIEGTFAVQCKRQSKPVGTAAVQQVVAGAKMHGCPNGMTFVVSNQTFTPAAMKLAESSYCGLYGRDNFDAFMSIMKAVANDIKASDDLKKTGEPTPYMARAIKRTTAIPRKSIPQKRKPKPQSWA